MLDQQPRGRPLWTRTVKPGRFARVVVENGDVLSITSITLCSTEKNVVAEIYIGMDSSKEDFLIATLCGSTKPHIKTDLILTEDFTLGHSGYKSVTFTGYYTRRRERTQLPLPIPQATEKQIDETESSERVPWPLNTDLTLKIFSNLNCTDVAHLEIACKQFNAVGKLPDSYGNVDLSHRPLAEDLDALVMIRRSCGQLSSLVLGTGRPTMLYTSKCLEPLLSKSAENCLKKLHLFGLDAIDDDILSPVLTCCIHLSDLELDLRLVTIERVLGVLGGGTFKSLKRLFYRSSLCNIWQNTISDQCLEIFLEKCGTVRFLGLANVSVKDAQVARILATRLTYLNLNSSIGFSGEFFTNDRSRNSEIQVLVLEECQLSQNRITEFVDLLAAGDYMNNMKEIYLTDSEKRDITTLGITRPGIKIHTRMKRKRPYDDSDSDDKERSKSLLQLKGSRDRFRTSGGETDEEWDEEIQRSKSLLQPRSTHEIEESDEEMRGSSPVEWDEEIQRSSSLLQPRLTHEINEESGEEMRGSSDAESDEEIRGPSRVLVELPGDEYVGLSNEGEMKDSEEETNDEYDLDNDVSAVQYAQDAAERFSMEANREGRECSNEDLLRVKNEAMRTLKMNKMYPEDYVGGDPSYVGDGKLRRRRRFIYW